MAYTTPVLALIVDLELAAGALGEPKDYFHVNSAYRTRERIKELGELTGLGYSLNYFMMQDSDYIEVGVQLDENFTLRLSAATLAAHAKTLAGLKANYPHPVVQSMELAVVSQFC